MLVLRRDRLLPVSSLIEHSARHHPRAEIVSKTCEGAIRRSNDDGLRSRAAKLAMALVKLGIGPGDRVATLAWNVNTRGVDLTSARATDCCWRAAAAARTKVLPKKQRPCPN